MRHFEIGSDGRFLTVETDQSYDLTSPLFPIGVQEVLTAASPAVSLNCYLSVLDATSNGVAATLADGAVNGQMKKVQASVVSGGAVTLTLASAESASLDVITFTVIGDYAILIWYDQDDDGNGYWKILERNDEDGDVDTPTVA